MSATLAERYNDAVEDQEFQHKVLVALVEAAINNVAPSATEGDNKRSTFAKSVIDSPLSHLSHVAMLVVADGTDNTATDAAIRTRVGDLWNAFSGVRDGDDP